MEYEAPSEELVFVPGVKSMTVEIPLIKKDNHNNEQSGNKTFSVMFGDQGWGFLDEFTALVVIVYNDR